MTGPPLPRPAATAVGPLPEVSRDRLRGLLTGLYGEARCPGILARIEALAAGHRRRHGTGARWSAADAVLVSYGDSIQSPSAPPLQSLARFLDHHVGDAFPVLHVLPFFPYSSDDGFSIKDYRRVDPELGDWQDIAALARDRALMVDLVLNHASREGLWFSNFLEDREPGRGYFLEVDPALNLSRVVRPRSSSLLTTVHTHRGARTLWTTFSGDQIDLDFRNPEVLLELVGLLLEYVAAGARIVRLDAIAYLWKEPGTSCIHLPQTHAVVKLMRALLDAVEPRALLLTETNVPNEENLSYFGDGDEAHLVYQFSLPPLILHGLVTGTTRHLGAWLRGLAPPPSGCSFLNFTASHDGVGLRPLEGLVPADEIGAFLDRMRARGGYISTRRTVDGGESPYELNVSYWDALREPGPAPDRWHLARFLLSQTVMLSLQGIPAVYILSLLATPNDLAGVERSGRIRSINRRKWDALELSRLLAQPDSPQAAVLGEVLRRVRIRARQPAFHPDAPQRLLDLDPDLLGFTRHGPAPDERLTCLYNFTAFERRVPGAALGLAPGARARDLLGGRRPGDASGGVTLAPYGALWLAGD